MASSANDGNAIEVGGIRFETIMPERTIVLPTRQLKAKVHFECGIRLTNTMTTPQSVLLFSMHPEFRDAKSNQIVSGEMVGAGGTWEPTILNYRLMQPGESTVLIQQGRFHWWENAWRGSFVEKGGETWVYRDFEPGLYSIQFVYSNDSSQQQRLLQAVSRSDGITNAEVMNTWTGEVTTPPITFCLLTSLT